jgi:hypothetical protein
LTLRNLPYWCRLDANNQDHSLLRLSFAFVPFFSTALSNA